MTSRTQARPKQAELQRIRMLLTDVDGVLTDGRIYCDANGMEVKSFHVHDLAGLAYWHRAGGLSGFVSGRRTAMVEERARRIGVHEIHLGELDKSTVLDDILARRSLDPSQVAYLGDDLLDLPVLARVGLAVSVPGGREEVRAAVHLVTRTAGGHGALREVVEILLRARGSWEDIVAKGGRP